jgi:hypothetical protein
MNRHFLIYSGVKNPLFFVLLENSREESGWHTTTVFLPGFSILMTAAVFIAIATMHKEDYHVKDVKVWKKMLKTASQAISQRSHEIKSVSQKTKGK